MCLFFRLFLRVLQVKRLSLEILFCKAQIEKPVLSAEQGRGRGEG